MLRQSERTREKVHPNKVLDGNEIVAMLRKIFHKKAVALAIGCGSDVGYSGALRADLDPFCSANMDCE
jgi:hypothetical protein